MQKIHIAVVTLACLCTSIGHCQNYNQFPSKLYSADMLPIEDASLSVTGVGSTIDLDITERSPLNGKPTIKCVAKAGQVSVFKLVFAIDQTLYPNVGVVIKSNTSLADGNGFPVVCFGPASDHYRTFSLPNIQEIGGIAGKWHYYAPLRDSLKTYGNPASWATDTGDQAYTTNTLRFIIITPASDVEFYIGSVWTLNEPKAKLIMTFDSPAPSIIDEVLSRLQAKGWKGTLAVYPYDHPTSDAKGWDTEIGRGRIHQLYNAGWDIVNHSGKHEKFADETEAVLIKSFAEYKEWALRNGWIRGSDFSCYPYRQVSLPTKDGGDIIDPYITMGRGRAYRPIYGQTGIKNNTYGFYNSAIPFDMLNLADIDVSQGSQADYFVAGGVRELLENTVNHRGVLITFGHEFLTTPVTETHNSIEWLDDWIADIQMYVDAGTLEVVTMTDWYNDIFGVQPSVVQGDIDGDGDVDVFDFALMAANWMQGTE